MRGMQSILRTNGSRLFRSELTESLKQNLEENHDELGDNLSW